MHRRLRDAAGTAAVLLVLFGVLMTMSPLLRERVSQLSRDKSDRVLVPAKDVVSNVMVSTGATAVRYATNNGYKVVFLIVAGVLFILMLRA